MIFYSALVGLHALLAVNEITPTVFYGRIQKIESGKVSFTRSATSEEGGMAKGKGKKKGGFSRSGAETLPVATDILITTAHVERRTGDFHVGTPLGGGLRNSAMKKLSPGASARIVIHGGKVIELNIAFADQEDVTVIAIPPRQVPKK